MSKKYDGIPAGEKKFRDDGKATVDVGVYRTFTLSEKELSKDTTTIKVVDLATTEASGYFYETENTKDLIVLHFTAGFLHADVAMLTRDDYHVSVAYVLARDGTVYRLWDDKYYSGHLGGGPHGSPPSPAQGRTAMDNTLNKNSAADKRSVAIEICNIGPLTRDGDKLNTAFGSYYCDIADTDAYVEIDEPFRDHTFFATYTDEQYTSLKKLLKYIVAVHPGIPYEFLEPAKRYQVFTPDEAKTYKGIATHINFRGINKYKEADGTVTDTGKYDKWDIGPAFHWDRLMDKGRFCYPVDLGLGYSVTDENHALYHQTLEQGHRGGYFPLGTNTVWHGGVHVFAPKGSKVVAYTEGTVVAARLMEKDPDGDQRLGSRNFVLVRHVMKGKELNAAQPAPIVAVSVLKDGGWLYDVPGGAGLGSLYAGDRLRTYDSKPFTDAEGGLWRAVWGEEVSDPILAGIAGYVMCSTDAIAEEPDPAHRTLDPDKDYPFYSLYMHLGSQPMKSTGTNLAPFHWLPRKKPPEPAPAPAPPPTPPPAAPAPAPADNTLVVKSDCRLRDKADMDTAQIGWFVKGAEVTKVKEEGAFYLVDLNRAANGTKIGFNPGVEAPDQAYIAKSMTKPKTAAPAAGGGASPVPQAKEELDQDILDRLVSGEVVALECPIRAGEPVWISGEYGSPDHREPLLHWEVFSEENIAPNWAEVIDSDENYTVDSEEILEMLGQGWFGTCEVLTFDEVATFYESNLGALELRRHACKFVSEWGIDLDQAIAQLEEIFQMSGMRDIVEPYLWWPEAVSAGVSLPAETHTWHYNPIELAHLLGRTTEPPPKPKAAPAPAGPKTLSGKDWVTWASTNAPGSNKLADLGDGFRENVTKFVDALKAAGATVTYKATFRPPKRAYLFHWSWLIGLGKAKAKDAGSMDGVDIQWDHGDDDKSTAAAKEMIDGFGLAVPPDSTNAPALESKHTQGLAIDMNISWTGTLTIATPDGTGDPTKITSTPRTGAGNTDLHAVGASYGVHKLTTDAPHWSDDGH